MRANSSGARPCIYLGCGAEAWANAVLSRSRRSPSSFLGVSNEAAIVWARVEGVKSRNKGLMGGDTPKAIISL